MKNTTPVLKTYLQEAAFLLVTSNAVQFVVFVLLFYSVTNVFGQTYTMIKNGNYDDRDVWSLDNGTTRCNCRPPTDKIEDGKTVAIKHDIIADSDVNIVIEDGGKLFMISGKLDVEQNLDVKPGGYFETSKSYIYSSNGNIKNEGAVVHNFNCLILINVIL